MHEHTLCDIDLAMAAHDAVAAAPTYTEAARVSLVRVKQLVIVPKARSNIPIAASASRIAIEQAVRELRRGLAYLDAFELKPLIANDNTAPVRVG